MELLFIGNELLNGKITNTNAQWLCEKITNLGAIVYKITTIPDDIFTIAKNIKDIITRKPDFLIISGGLGPTFDDMTLRGIEKALGENYKLQLNEKALEMVEKQYKLAKKLKIINDDGLTEHRIKMASIPRGSIPLYNPVGTAPGILIELDNMYLISLPGVPQEMKAIFRKSILPRITEKVSKTEMSFFKAEFIVENKVESELAPIVDKVMGKVSNIWIKTHPRLKSGMAWVEVNILCRDKEKIARKKVQKVEKELRMLIEEFGGKIKEIN
jgi:molybdenum cofactor synthesis domain-containing protein